MIEYVGYFVGLVGLGIIGLFVMAGRYLNLWFQAFISGAPISLFNIVGMSLRKISPRLIVNARINLCKAGLREIRVADLETHYLAGGHLTEVVRAVIAANKAKIPLTWEQATAIDLAGRDVFEAVKTSVYPKVIDCPMESNKMISAVAGNGIELLVKARVTVRTNIEQLVGGATEETIIARVGEGIVNAIGSADSHYDVLKNPQSVSELVLSKGLDTGTAFAILSIDIADINVGSNVGASLQSQQAQADMKVAQANAESRKAMAIAKEQENRAKVVEAEAKVPMAIAMAFESGKLGIMDYNRMENVSAETGLYKALGFALAKGKSVDELKEELKKN